MLRACECGLARAQGASGRERLESERGELDPRSTLAAFRLGCRPRVRALSKGFLEPTSSSVHRSSQLRTYDASERTRGAIQDPPPALEHRRHDERHVALAATPRKGPNRALAARGATQRGSSRRDFRRGREAEAQLYRAYCKLRRQSPRRKDQARCRDGLRHGLLERRPV